MGVYLIDIMDYKLQVYIGYLLYYQHQLLSGLPFGLFMPQAKQFSLASPLATNLTLDSLSSIFIS